MQYRTHRLDTLSSEDVGKNVILSGWVHKRRNLGKLIFIDLRDQHGITQIIFDPEINSVTHKIAEEVRSEWVLRIKGVVRLRAEGMENRCLKTGAIEVEATKITILSKAKTPPFSISDEELNVNEELKLQYRYLDMRRGNLLKNLKIRHQLTKSIRDYFDHHGFTEVETPILGKSTPEGARDYLVPSRVHPGSFYALPQSPQQYKQLLMIGGLDRYFQIAKCFRDEDLRADRQPEFTQLDVEISFTDVEELININEGFLKKAFKDCLNCDIQTPITRISYQDALEFYGTDKPDVRFEMKFQRVDDLANRSEFRVFKETLANKGCIKALVIPKASHFSRREIDEMTAFVAQFGLKGLPYFKEEEGRLQSSLTKFFDEALLQEFYKKLKVQPGDLIVFGCGLEESVNQALDHLRRDMAKKLGLIKSNQYAFLWVLDFPLFVLDNEGNFTSAHHPFTAPLEEDIPHLVTNPGVVRAKAYDIVLNGYEIGGGSIRIHQPETQKAIFQVLNLSEEEIEEKFGFFIEALSFGTPPHGGIAYGIDRITMLLTETENIKDVISFPKTMKAADLMNGCPSSVANKQLNELSICCS